MTPVIWLAAKKHRFMLIQLVDYVRDSEVKACLIW